MSTSPEATGLSLVSASPAHVAVLAELHARSFSAPWSATDFAALMALPGTVARMAVDAAGGPVGFVLLRAAAGEAEVLTFCVAPDRRRSGIGRRLLSAGAAAVRNLGAEELFLEVAADNRAALALYRVVGFHEVGRRNGYYAAQDGGEAIDAVLLRLSLTADADP